MLNNRSNIIRSNLYYYNYFLPLLLVVLFSSIFVSRLTGLSFLEQIDELFILTVISVGIFLGILSGYVNLLLLYYLYGILLLITLSLAGGYSSNIFIIVLSSVLYLKIIPTIYIFRNAPHINITVLMNFLFIFCLIGGFISFMMPDLFLQLLPNTSYKISTDRMLGFFVNANRQGALASLLFIYFWFVKKRKIPALIALLILALTGSRSYLLVSSILFLYLFYANGGRLSIYLLTPIILSLIAYVLVYEFNVLETFEKVQGTINSDLRYIRIAMLFGGYSLATEFFPFGAGGGQFGSPLSHGGQAYVSLGISEWATVVEGTGIHDSGIGTILGEYGFFGFFLLAILIFQTFRVWGKNWLTRMDIYLLLGLIFYQSLFRQIIPDFYFSFITIGYAIVIISLRQRNYNAYPTGPQ